MSSFTATAHRGFSEPYLQLLKFHSGMDTVSVRYLQPHLENSGKEQLTLSCSLFIPKFSTSLKEGSTKQTEKRKHFHQLLFVRSWSLSALTH